MHKLFSGRVRAAIGTSGVATPGGLASAATERLRDALAGLGERVADAAASAATRAGWKTALATIVAGELRGITAAGTVTGLAGRRQAAALSVLATNADGAAAAWEADLCRLVRTVETAVRLGANPAALVTVEVPLIDLSEAPGRLLSDIIALVLGRAGDGGALGQNLAATIKGNLLAVSGLSAEEAAKRPQRLLWPSDAKGTAGELVERYFGGTALADALRQPVPFAVGLESFFEHCWGLAKSGHGKTQAIEWLVANILRRADYPSLVVIDSQGELLQRIGRLPCFAPGGAWQDRLVYIDPREMQRPVALNPFALRRERMASYTPAMREQVTNGTIELMEFLFGSVLGAELTQKQGVIFRYLARLLMAIPGANIVTLRDCLEEPERFADAMARLDGSARHFFERQFFGREYAATRGQILRRLWGVFEQPTFERMLSAPENKLDFFETLQAGRVVLVDTAMDFLKEERSRILGRLIVAMTLQAVFERAALAKERRRATFLIIDEAHEILDEHAAQFLTQARKFHCGVCVFHQHLKQLPAGLRSALANASVKLVGKVTAGDADDMAADMGTTAALLLGLRKEERVAAEFALNVGNVTVGALRTRVPFGVIDAAGQMSEAAWQRLLRESGERYGASWQPAAPPRAPAKRASRRGDDPDGWFS